MAEENAVGTLNEHLTGVALRIRQLVDAQSMTVWVDETGAVYAQKPEDASRVPSNWVVGTFSSATTVGDIEIDLRAVLRERARDWIVD